MTREERAVRDALAELAAEERGRRLLQLALRGIEESGCGVTIGCWTKEGAGASGCVFQHAYWRGISEGSFVPADQAATAIRGFVAAEDFALVMAAIRAFDALGRRRFLRRRGLRRELDEAAWRDTVERLLVGALAAGAERTRPAELATSR
jgi:hypothetical protein